jgi:resuscitation-promoting factor RpfB
LSNRKALLAAGAVIAVIAITHPHTATPAAPQSLPANQALGRLMAAEAPYRWTGGQWSCLAALWVRESGWSAYAANPASDARGIPQDINGWSAYAPGDARAQIAWGLAYIAGRYGSPCAAWSHEQTSSWY